MSQKFDATVGSSPPDAMAGSSPPDATVGSSPSDATAGSSPSVDEANAPPVNLLDVVRNAVEPKDEADDPSPEPEAEKSSDEVSDEAAEPAEEDYSELSFHKHPRFEKIVRQRAAFKEQAETLRNPAEQYQRIEAFMQHNGLDNEAVVDLFRIGALIRNDPEKAYEAVADTLLELAKITGRSLPTDLVEDVEYGRISEERAAELSRERARVARLEAATVEQARVRQTDQTQQTVQGVRTAVADWEARTRASDPDFKVKEKLIADRVSTLAAQNGRPQSPDQAVKLITQAHREITTELKAVAPGRPSIARPMTSSSSATATAVPKTLREAIEVAAKGMTT